MIFADINWLNISINLLLVVFVIVCLLMALLILMQRPKQEGLGAAFGGGVTDQVFGARTTNVLQRGTVYLGSMFFILALSLAILIGKQTKQKSLLEPEKPATQEESAVESEDGKIAEEPKDDPKSLAEELPADETPEPVAEEAPAPTTEEAPAEGTPSEESAAPIEEPAAPAAEENKADKPE
ncbi:MAG: preprotein translocase subunit SecG [Luteolibacter sp.]